MWGASWTMCKSLSFLQVLGHAPLPSSYFMGGSNGRGHVIHVEVVWVDVLAKATHATNVKEVIMGEAQPPRGATRCPQPYLIYCILTAGHTGASLGGAAGLLFPHSPQSRGRHWTWIFWPQLLRATPQQGPRGTPRRVPQLYRH